MANDYDITARNLMVDALAAVAVRVALHSGDPGTANQANNELSGGGYARGTLAWNAASNGEATLNGNVDISIEAGDTVAWISYWNSAGTVRYLKKDVTDEAFGGAGTYRLNGTTTKLDLNDA
jgi:hypothetical protein